MRINERSDTYKICEFKMSKFVQDIVVQQTCDTLVYRYLVEKGHLRTAKLLKEERKNSYTLTAKKDEKVSEIFSHLIPKYVQMELDSVSSNLAWKSMKIQKFKSWL